MSVSENAPAELLQSATEFLVEALDNFQAGKYKLSIVHGVTAAELMLKARLATLHPALIFADVDRLPTKKGPRTIDLRSIPVRLRNFGSPLKKEHEDLVLEFADWRNDIVHHMPRGDIQTISRKLPTLIDFISAFLRSDLHTRLETFLPTRLFTTAERLLSDWQQAIQAARQRAKDKANAIGESCPTCAVTGVLGAVGSNQAYCYLCQQTFELHFRCAGCGHPLPPMHVNEFLDNAYCRDCIDAAGERYLEELIDKKRGK
jgi:hypothetical protein